MQQGYPYRGRAGPDSGRTAGGPAAWWAGQVDLGRGAAEVRGLVHTVRDRLRGRDLLLAAAGLTVFAAVALVPTVVVALGLITLLAGADRVRALSSDTGAALPDRLGAPHWLEVVTTAGTSLSWPQLLLSVVPLTFYGEGLRRALLRFGGGRDSFTGWRGRLATLPLVVAAPLLLWPLLQVGALLGRWVEGGNRVGAVVVGYYAVLAALAVPLAWGFRVVAAGRLRWRAVLPGALFTAACLSGFLQGFVAFLALPLDLGLPFGGLDAVGGVVAIGFWLVLLHVVVIVCWLATWALDERLPGPPAPGPAPRMTDDG